MTKTKIFFRGNSITIKGNLEETNKDLNDETIVNDTTGQPVKVTGEYEIDVFGLSAQVNYTF